MFPLGECKSKGNQDSRRKDTVNTGYKARDNGKRPAKQDEHKAMVTIDGEGVDWTCHAEDETEDCYLMAFNSNNSGSDTEVTFCLKVCEESYAILEKIYDEQKEQLGVASIEIQAYTLALKKEGSSSYTDDLMYSFFANQSSGPQLDHEDLKQVDESDLEEIDLKWQVAMISTRLEKFYKKTGRKLHFDAKEPVGFDKSKVECFNCYNT
nr:ribonuclease H-like domain-containing protein [Tanacetum cinerariifolium]